MTLRDVTLPPARGARPTADSLSPNRSDTIGSVDNVEAAKSQPDAQPITQPAAQPAVQPAAPVLNAAQIAASYLHSRSASLDGGDVCSAPTDLAVSAALANPIPATTLAPLSISNNPVVAVTVDGATPPVVAIPVPQFPIVASQPPPAAVEGLEPTETEPPKVL